jgi:predicted ABC-type ATPase
VKELPPKQPIIVAIAGPNGAGKSTFYRAYFEETGLPFVNADFIAREAGSGDVYEAAMQAAMMRHAYLAQRDSFIFETVLSDPVGDKIDFLKNAVDTGYAVVLCFIGLASAELSETRVAMRVSQGGHDVPAEKLRARYPRSLENLKRAVAQLPDVLIYDNSNLTKPFSLVVWYRKGKLVKRASRLPHWVAQLQLPG